MKKKTEKNAFDKLDDSRSNEKKNARFFPILLVHLFIPETFQRKSRHIRYL